MTGVNGLPADVLGLVRAARSRDAAAVGVLADRLTEAGDAGLTRAALDLLTGADVRGLPLQDWLMEEGARPALGTALARGVAWLWPEQLATGVMALDEVLVLDLLALTDREVRQITGVGPVGYGELTGILRGARLHLAGDPSQALERPRPTRIPSEQTS